MKTKCSRCGEMTNAPILDHVKDGKSLIDGPICPDCFHGVESIHKRNLFALPASTPVSAPKPKDRRATTRLKSRGYSVFMRQGRDWYSATYHGNGNGDPRLRIHGKPTTEFVEALEQAIEAAKRYGTYSHAESQRYLRRLQSKGEYSISHLIDEDA